MLPKIDKGSIFVVCSTYLNDRVAYGHFTPIADPKLQKLRLTFNFNSEDNKGLYYQYDFSGRSETINNNEPTHLERKRKSRGKCTLSCFCKCPKSEFTCKYIIMMQIIERKEVLSK